MVMRMPRSVSAGFAPQSRICATTWIDFGEALEGEVFALERDEEFVGGGEGVGHEDAERGRAIEQDEVERRIRAQRLEGGAQPGEVIRRPRAISISAPARSRSPGMIQRFPERVGTTVSATDPSPSRGP